MTDTNDAMIGTLAAGRYRVMKLLGEGGMGQVYLAEHVAIEKRVALKVLRAEYANKGEIVTRFQQEAISASRIKHPNVLDVFDFGQLDNGCFFLAMEFLEGNDLADEITRRRVLDAATGIRVSMQICRALAAAHANGVVHRDMKPENVFLQRTADGEEIVKIVDFGIAQLRAKDEAVVETKRRLTRTGMIFGTPEYMAPEQASGKHADLRADIYAVGIIMYEMFTGAVPFTGETFLGVLTKHLNEPAPLMNVVYPELTISPSLQAVIMRALEKDPTVRYQTMLEFAQAISGSSDAAALGYRPTLPSQGDHSLSYLPHAPGTPTHQQFAPATAAPPVTTPVPAPLSPVTTNHKETDAARAETLIGAEADTRPPGRSKGGLAAALVAVVALGSGGAWFMAKRNAATTSPTPETSGALAAKPPDPLAPPPSAAPSAAPLFVASAEPANSADTTVTPTSGIRLDVSSEPSGATLLKNGFQVCDSTPCEVLAAPAETLEFQAVKGALKGSAKVLAQRDQKVTIKLSGGSAAAPAKPPSQRMCEVEVDGLKSCGLASNGSKRPQNLVEGDPRRNAPVIASPAMRILRRTLIGGLCALALGSLIGCKKPAGDSATTGGGSNEGSAEIVIGHYASMTGGTAHFGQDTDRGIRLAVEEANAKGGVLGKKIKLVTLDTRGDSAEAANAVSRLIDVEKVSAVLGEVASSLSLAGGRVAQRRKIPMISPTSTNPKVTEVGDYIFRVCFIDPFQGKVMATFARKNLKLDKVAILKDVKNDYSIGLADAFRKSYTEMGGAIAAEQSYSQGDTDFSAQVTAIRGTGAQALFVPGYYSEVGSIARTADRLGLKVPLLGGDGWDSPDLFKIGGDAINGSYFSDHFAPDVSTDKAKAFVANFSTKYGQPPTGLGALGYEAALVLIDAIGRAGKNDPTAIRDAIAATKDFEGVTGKITIDAQRNAQKSAVVLKVEGGKAKFETSIAP